MTILLVIFFAPLSLFLGVRLLQYFTSQKIKNDVSNISDSLHVSVKRSIFFTKHVSKELGKGAVSTLFFWIRMFIVSIIIMVVSTSIIYLCFYLFK